MSELVDVTNPSIWIKGIEAPVKYHELVKDKASKKRYLNSHHRTRDGVICMCKETGIPLGVGLRQGTYYLYPLHHSDQERHAIGCPNYRNASDKESDERLLEYKNGRVVLKGRIAKENNNSERATLAGDEVLEVVRKVSIKKKQQVIRNILEALWVQAELNVWRPWFDGKRDYKTVRNRLVMASKNLYVDGLNVGEHLLIPYAYNFNAPEVSIQQYEKFQKRLYSNEVIGGFVVGFVKKIHIDKTGRSLLFLQHCPRPMVVSKKNIDKFFGKFSIKTGSGIALKKYDLVVSAFVIKSRCGHRLYAASLSGFRVNNYRMMIPISTTSDEKLLSHLYENERRFRKPMFVESKIGSHVPFVVLEDVEDRTHLEVFDSTMDMELLKDIQAHYSDKKQSVWWWNAEGPIPPLPNADRR